MMEDAAEQKTFADIHYRGFSARVEYDEDDCIFVGHLTGIRELVGFHAYTLDDLNPEYRVPHFSGLPSRMPSTI